MGLSIQDIWSGGRWQALLRKFLYNQVLGRGLMGSWMDSGPPLARSRGHIWTKHSLCSQNVRNFHQIFSLEGPWRAQLARYVSDAFQNAPDMPISAIYQQLSPWSPWGPMGPPGGPGGPQGAPLGPYGAGFSVGDSRQIKKMHESGPYASVLQFPRWIDVKSHSGPIGTPPGP